MNIESAINQMQAVGFTLTVVDDNKLSVSPGDKLTVTQTDFIRQHKPELIKALSQNETPKFSDDDLENIRENLNERSAIQEFDGGLSGSEAEKQARSNMKVYHYRLKDVPGSWLVMIAPGCDLNEARRTVNTKFGKDRVIDVREYKYSLEK